MRVICYFAVGVTIFGSALSSRVLAQSSPPTADARPTATAAAAPAVTEQADRLLRQMGAYIGSAGQFTFHADITFDHVLPSGQKLQFSAAEDVALQRPNRLYAEWSGDLGDRQFWYYGTSITLYDPATPFYATGAAPPDIDSMLEKLVQQVGFAPPLADFLYHDPYQSVVPPPQGTVVVTPPPSCSTVYVGSGTSLDCGGTFYASVPNGYEVIPPPVGATVKTLPDGAVDQNINGTTYFTFGGAYYQPFYSGAA